MPFITDATATGCPELDQHLQYVRDFDWSSTSLGPLHSWPQDLLQLVHVMLLDPQPRLLLLGTNNWMLYNSAYAKVVCGDKHPETMGMTQAAAWGAEVEKSIIDGPNATRESGLLSQSVDEYHVSLMRNGSLEETVLTWSMIPLGGTLTGVYVSVTDVTEGHVAERRKSALSKIEKAWSVVKDLDSLWKALPRSLTTYWKDISFAALYSVPVGPEFEAWIKHSLEDDTASNISYHLESYESHQSGFIGMHQKWGRMPPLVWRAMNSKDPILVKSDDDQFPKAWMGAFGDQGPVNRPNAAVISPIRYGSSEQLKLLVVGLSAKNPYNDNYRNWMLHVVQELKDTVASLLEAEEEERERSRARAETLERASQSEKKASHVTERLSRMQFIVDQVDVGIFEIVPDGTIVQANDAYHDLSGIPKAHIGVEQLAFAQYVYPEDLDGVMREWNSMNTGTVSTFEMRWKAPMNEYGEDFTWTLAACIPVLDETGTTTSIHGCITNIGAQKRAEGETRKRVGALERARVSEQRFSKFMEHAPVAVIVVDPNNQITYVNSNWFDLTEHDRVTDYSQVDWTSTVYPEDLQIVLSNWGNIYQGQSVSVQYRLTALWKGGDGPAFQKWVQATAWAEMEDGVPKQVIGTLTDISHLKFAEGVQRLRIEQAIESKRQQENFIDMTSHEICLAIHGNIRNPLSAVVHCVDSISDSLQEMDTLAINLMSSPEVDKARQLHEYIEGSMEAADTIRSCTAHQKRIVDDILVLSKLDSNLLQISPSPTNAVNILLGLDKMFEAEASREGVTFVTEADSSLGKLNIDALLLDHGRINQILINLITNAIKFTKHRDSRDVTVRMGVAEQRPIEADIHGNFNFDFTLSSSLRDSVYDTPEFAEDELYLWFTVQDTGRGMTKEEKSKIFARFQQASVRTYSEYGGSGLGLFISHSLVGLQGGEIGVSTEAGVGSTFFFFVRTTRCVATALKTRPTEVKGQRASTPTGIAGRRIGVLIVEDNLLNQRVLKKQLSKNYDVYTADQGQEALDFLKTTRHWRDQPTGNMHRDRSSSIVSTISQTSINNHSGDAHSGIVVDVILLDIEMPVMGGLECARHIRDMQKQGKLRNHIPIIAVSANARPEQISQALEAGMDDAISKPFRIPDLIPKMDRLVGWTKATHIETC